jgi:hypothetical protein
MQKQRKTFPIQSWKKHFEMHDVIAKFEDVRQTLNKTIEDPLLSSNKHIASLIHDLILFQDKTFGIDVSILIVALVYF